MAVSVDPDVKINYSTGRLIRDLAEFIRPYAGRFWLASLIRFTGDVSWLYPAIAIASIVTFVTNYQRGESFTPLILILAIWAGAIFVRITSQFFAKFIGFQVAERVAIDSSLKTIAHLFRLDMLWHERENSGNKIKRISNAAMGFDRIIRIWFERLIEITVNLVGISIVLATFDVTLVIALAAFSAVYFTVSIIMTNPAAKMSYIVHQHEEEITGLMYEAIANIRTVKIMALARSLSAIIAESAARLFARIRIRIFRYQSMHAVLSFIAYGFRLGVVVFIVVGIMEGRYEVGLLVLFYTYAAQLRESIDELSNSMQEFITYRYSIARMREVLDTPVGIEREEGKGELHRDWRALALRNVSFSYGDREVLHDLTFTIHRGEKVGIVGLSGAGKSTLFKLLLKEREEYTGDVMFDDASIRDLKSSDYSKHVSAVLQDTEVFNLSLKDNITITNPDERTDTKLIESAIETAHVSDFLQKLPQGLDTIVGEKGFRLSGGERQRLGIARAIFKEPELLLLDEATSHLDSESEEKIRDSLGKFFEKVTAIVIAHRLSTIRQMDRILVIEEGKLIEEGTFDELHAQNGRFRELWEKQKI